jgi:polar amino acid transport system substrate-binding protein
MFRSNRGRAVLAAVSALSVLGLSACSGGDTKSAVDASCKPQHQFSTVNKGSLTVATYEFAPHSLLNGNDISGIEGELLKEVAARECLTLKLQTSGGAAAAVPAVQTGRADLAAGDWWRTKARAEIVSLSDPLYLDQGALVSTKGYKTIADLEGHTFGSVVGNLWNDQFTQVFGDKFKVYQDGESAFSDLAAGRVDAIIDSVGATTARLKDAPIQGAQIVPLQYDPRIPVTKNPGQVNWPTSKKNPDLTTAINAQIEAMHADGTIEKMLEKYGIGPEAAQTGDPYEL